MSENPLLPFTFIAGPAILMNACSVMQNGTNLRYNLAITHLREFRMAFAADNKESLSQLFTDPILALKIAIKRINLLLLGMNLLYAAIGMFGLTAFLGLTGAFFANNVGPAITEITAAMVLTTLIGMIFLLSAVFTFIVESTTATKLLRLRMEHNL